MKTIIKIEDKELFEFDNSRDFTLGQEVKCYGEPYIVVSMQRKKTNIKAEIEVIVSLMKKDLYHGIVVKPEDFNKYGISTKPCDKKHSITIGIKNAPQEPKFTRNPFDGLMGY